MGEEILKGNARLFKGLRQTRWAIFAIGLCTTFLFAGLYMYMPYYLKLLDLKLYDSVIAQTYTPPKSHAVAVVDIDEYSISTFGHWPWPRYRVALLLKKIQMAGALAVGADILFGEPDGTSPRVLKEMMKRDLKIDIGFQGLPEQLMDNDALLADILARGPFALGYSFYFQKGEIKSRDDVQIPVFKHALVREPGAGRPRDIVIQARQVIPPLAALLASGAGAGYMNTQTDMDGVLRRVPLVMSWKGKLYPHLSLVTLLTALKGRVPAPILKINKGGIGSMKIGSTVIPLERNGAMLINYKGPSYTFPFISAGRVLEDTFDPGSLKNKVVFLGSSAAGLMDIRVSPLAEVYPGVEVNATIVDNILSKDFIRRPDWVPGMELMIICLWGLISAVSIGWAGPVLTLVASVSLGAGAWAGGLIALKYQHIWISPFFPLMVLVVNFSLLNLFKFWLSERRKRFYRSAFSKYVSKAVVDQISDSPEKMSLAGEEKEMTIMFTDIRSFTSISEQLSPTQVTDLLHDYFTPVTHSIIANHGTLDKFIGDAVMCFWNAPLDVADHPDLAVKTGFEMLASLEQLNREFKPKYGVEINIGIGIHAGSCRVGNMGSSDLFDYTIIGDNVNLTSRLEGLTKYYGVRLIISESVKIRLKGEYLFQELDKVRVKGKTEPVGIFTLSLPGSDDVASGELTAWDKGLELYRGRAFSDAVTLFSNLAKQFPGKKVYALYRDRCAFFLDNPPARDWDGVFTHETK